MKRIISIIILIGIIYVASTILRSEIATYIQGASLMMSGITESSIREMVLTHYNSKILSKGDTLPETTPLNIQLVHINSDSHLDVIAVPEDDSVCGSGGCIASIFIQNEFNTFSNIPFEFAVKSITVTSSITNGMRDIRINDDTTTQMIWNGTQYTFNTI